MQLKVNIQTIAAGLGILVIFIGLGGYFGYDMCQKEKNTEDLKEIKRILGIVENKKNQVKESFIAMTGSLYNFAESDSSFTASYLDSLLNPVLTNFYQLDSSTDNFNSVLHTLQKYPRLENE